MSRAREAERDDPRGGRQMRSLPLQASVSPAPRGWLVRLPLAAEWVTVEKQALVYEEVAVRTVRREGIGHLCDAVRREVPRLERSGGVRLDACGLEEERP